MSKRIIEINGRKFEVNEADLKVVDEFRVGDTVKVLKKRYNDDWESFYGAIIGYDNYKNLPTIRIMYIDVDYSDSTINIISYNNNTKDIEIAPMNEADLIMLDKARIIDLMNNRIEKKKQDLEDAKAEKDYFLKYFNAYFKASEKVDELLK
jgi:nicotinic acid mononucleotide adenylyltransferase